jgi:hypothetical protein
LQSLPVAINHKANQAQPTLSAFKTLKGFFTQKKTPFPDANPCFQELINLELDNVMNCCFFIL